ncbi:vascular endothelial growth factor B [Pseudophryne corroboree]|uniref:vascular endothelial growth factor B n=1 Tax=Pseudophryne corroboree TaxID=495146 RepID=UPI00308185F4
MDCVLASSLMWLSVFLHCILTPLSVSQTPQAQKLEGSSWDDIYNRSKCQPRWVLLNLLTEFPQFSDYFFLPSCVLVQRCAGCCLDETQGCFPLETGSIHMQVYKKKLPKPELTEISVTQHMKCECRPHDSATMKPIRLSSASGDKKTKKRRRKGKKGIRRTSKNSRSRCPPCDRRRTLNPKNCKCVCHRTEEICIKRGLMLNKERCRCEKPRS